MPILILDELTLRFDHPTSLIDLLDEDHPRAIPFGCYDGHCSSCMVTIHEGQEHLSPLTPKEHYTLTPREIAQGIRLACQISILSGQVSLSPTY